MSHAVVPAGPSRALKLEGLAFCFWMLASMKVLLMMIFFRDNPNMGTMVGGALNAAVSGFLGMLLLGGLRLQRGFRAPASTRWLVLYLLWSGLTLIWTSASSQFVATSYWVLTTLGVLTVYIMGRIGPIESIGLKSLQGIAWGSAILGVYTVLMGGITSDLRLGDETFLNPNALGKQMAIGALCAFHLFLRERRSKAARNRALALFAVLVFVLLQSLSKTAISAFVAGIAVYLLVSRRAGMNKGPLLLLMGGLFLASFQGLQGYWHQYLYETQGGEALGTVSGRTDIWEVTWEMIQQAFLQGYGHLSYRDTAPQIIAVRLVHAHNEVLQVWFEKGLIGLILVVGLYLSFCRDLRRFARVVAPGAPVALGAAFMAYTLVRGLTEASVTNLVFPHALMLMLGLWMANAPLEERSAESRPSPALGAIEEPAGNALEA